MTALKPDIVVVDKKKSVCNIYELTCPAEHRIATAHNLKTEKYSHFETDQNRMRVTVSAFEVGSHTGFLTGDNKTRLSQLHKYCRKSIKLKSFLKNISAITVISSYFIFNCRSQVLWPEMAFISPPFPNQ